MIFFILVLISTWSPSTFTESDAHIVYDARLLCHDVLTKQTEQAWRITEVTNSSQIGRSFLLCLGDNFQSTLDLQAIPRLDRDDTVDIVVNSRGGNTRPFIIMMEQLKNANIRLLIHNYCLSSCANYLVGMADKILVRSGPLIGWHGGPAGVLSEQPTQSEVEYVQDIELREKNLFSDRPKSFDLIYDSGKVVTCSRRLLGLPRSEFSMFWEPSTEFLEQHYKIRIENTSSRRRDDNNKLIVIDKSSGDVTFWPVADECMLKVF
ncbi:MAG: hypothetical protein MRY59_11935 [Aquisalinus sp.]|nr:hypothetical protein [Aquisalinus sp.]